MNKLDFALKMAELGYTVIPVNDNKRSFVSWDVYKQKIPSKEQIRAWNREFSNPNYAVITGKKLIVLDFETYEDATKFFAKFEELKGKTLVVRTAHGGVHIYFSNLDDSPGRHTKIFDQGHDVDLLSGDGYALLPYSEIDHSKCDPKKPCDHASKTVYEIISQTDEILSYEGEIVKDLFDRAVKLNWISEERAKGRIREWTGKERPSDVTYKPLPIGTVKLDRKRIVEVLLPYWTKADGLRNELTLAVAGFIARSGGIEDDAVYVVSELCRLSGKGCDHISGAKYAFRRVGPVKGFSSLKELMEVIAGD